MRAKKSWKNSSLYKNKNIYFIYTLYIRTVNIHYINILYIYYIYIYIPPARRPSGPTLRISFLFVWTTYMALWFRAPLYHSQHCLLTYLQWGVKDTLLFPMNSSFCRLKAPVFLTISLVKFLFRVFQPPKMSQLCSEAC